MAATAGEQPLGHRSRGRAAEPATPHRPRRGGRRRLADTRHGTAVARWRTAAAERSLAGARRTFGTA